MSISQVAETALLIMEIRPSLRRSVLVTLMCVLFSFSILAQGKTQGRPRSKLQKIKEKAPAKKNRPFERWSIGIQLIESFLYQWGRDIQTSADAVYQLSAFSGNTSFLALTLDIPINPTQSLSVGPVMRTVDMKGDAKSADSTLENKFNLLIDFVGVQVGIRYMPPNWDKWSWVSYFEYSKATKINLKVISGPQLDSSQLDKPNYYVFTTGFFYNLQMGKHFLLEAGGRGGLVTSTEPVTIVTEGLASIKYLF